MRASSEGALPSINCFRWIGLARMSSAQEDNLLWWVIPSVLAGMPMPFIHPERRMAVHRLPCHGRPGCRRPFCPGRRDGHSEYHRDIEPGGFQNPRLAAEAAESTIVDERTLCGHPEGIGQTDEMMTQLGSLRKLATAVAQAGRDTAAKGDAAQARKCFTSLKQCGTALDSPDSLRLVQLVGQGFKKMADTEMAKLGQ